MFARMETIYRMILTRKFKIMPTSHVLPPALDVGSSAATEKVRQLSAQAALSKDFSERSCQGRVSESGVSGGTSGQGWVLLRASPLSHGC